VLLGARRHRDGVRDFFSGMMDRVSIWRRALSTTEVAQWYVSQPVGVEAGLVAFFVMDEGRGAYVNSAAQSADGAAAAVPLQGVVRVSETLPGGESVCVCALFLRVRACVCVPPGAAASADVSTVWRHEPSQ
jgi:hypothetical protein